jgi:hypothetical protein
VGWTHRLDDREEHCGGATELCVALSIEASPSSRVAVCLEVRPS